MKVITVRIANRHALDGVATPAPPSRPLAAMFAWYRIAATSTTSYCGICKAKAFLKELADEHIALLQHAGCSDNRHAEERELVMSGTPDDRTDDALPSLNPPEQDPPQQDPVAPTISMPVVDDDRLEQTGSAFLSGEETEDVAAQRSDLDDGSGDSGHPKTGDKRKYRIGNIVGKGGMGAILVAKDLKIRRNVAMKVMLDPARAPEHRVLRFIEEAQVTGQLEHPGIVPVYELGTDTKGDPFYTMKFVRGVTLRDVLARIVAGDAEAIAAYPLPRLLGVFQRMCEALAYAHHRGVVHRDLKPENIMIGDFGEVLVLDWGLAKVVDKGPARQDRESTPAAVAAGTPKTSAREKAETTTSVIETVDITTEDDSTKALRATEGPSTTDASGSTLPEASIDSVRSNRDQGDAFRTMDGQILGTPRYMAPEQASGQIGDISPRTDVYSLGAILYNVLTLRPPISGEGLTEILQNVTQGQIAAPRALKLTASDIPHCPGGVIPTSLSAVAIRALALDPADRYQSAEELRQEIDVYLAGYATAAEEAGLYRQLCLLVKRHKREFGLLVATLVILACVVTGFMLKVNAEKNRAITNEALAKSNEQKAVDAQRDAEKARNLAETAKGEAEEAKDEAELENYISTIELAFEQLRKGNPANARRLLNTCPEKLRHWEWGHLDHLCQSAEKSSTTAPNLFHMVAGDPLGRGVLVSTRDCAIGLVPPEADRIETLWKGDGQQLAGGVVRPDGTAVALAYRGGLIRVIDLVEKKEITQLRFPPPGPSGEAKLAWQTGEDGLIAGMYEVDEHVYVWSLEKPEPMYVLKPGTRPISIAFSPLSRRLLATWVHRDGSVWQEWDTETHKSVRIVDAHEDRIRAVRYSPSGKYLMTCSEDMSGRIWEMDTGELVWPLPGHESIVWDGAFSPDERFAVTGSRDGLVRLWDVRSGRHIRSWHTRGVEGVAFVDDGRRLITASREKTLRSWDLRDLWYGSLFHEILTRHKGIVDDIQITPDLPYVAVANSHWYRAAEVHDLHSGELLNSYRDGNAQILSSATSPDGKWVAACGEKNVRVWPFDEPETVTVLEGHSADALELHFIPGTSRFVTIGRDGRILMWDTEGDETATELVNEPGRKWAMSAMSHSGQWMLVCSVGEYPCYLCCVSIPSGESLWRRETSSMWAIDVSDDDRRAACSVSGKNEIIIIDTADGKILRRMEGSRSLQLAVVFTHDGKRVISAAAEEIQVWIPDAERLVLSIWEPSENFKSLALTPDNLTLYAGGGHRRLKAYRCGKWTPVDGPEAGDAAGP